MMCLAGMVATDEDALICDLAETYRILNWRELSPKLVATLAFGLPEDSRIKRAITGRKINLLTTLEAAILDQLRTLVWLNTRDAQHGRNRPKSILEAIQADKTEADIATYASGEDFNSAWSGIQKGDD